MSDVEDLREELDRYVGRHRAWTRRAALSEFDRDECLSNAAQYMAMAEETLAKIEAIENAPPQDG